MNAMTESNASDTTEVATQAGAMNEMAESNNGQVGTMTYRQAEEKDLDDICLLIEKAIIKMEDMHIDQWDEQYPRREDFACDIRKGQCWVGIAEDVIAVVYTINSECDEQYQNGAWKYRDCEYRILHRICVHPDYQNQGIAKSTLHMIEKTLKEEGVGALQLDVYSENPFSLALYQKGGYQKTGTADWRKGRFYLMEKRL